MHVHDANAIMNHYRPEDPGMELRDARLDDISAITAIYNLYVCETTVSMEFDPVTPQAMAARIASIQDAGLPWLVLCDGGQLLGYAYASPWRARIGYRHAVESSVYLAPAERGRGIGTRLYIAVLERLRAAGHHTVIGGIALPNPGSVALHEKLGFAPVARFREVGRKFDEWVDVGYWQLMLGSEDATA
jgi:phosphinothricin acetyltransferase